VGKVLILGPSGVGSEVDFGTDDGIGISRGGGEGGSGLSTYSECSVLVKRSLEIIGHELRQPRSWKIEKDPDARRLGQRPATPTRVDSKVYMAGRNDP
jgi:hypothetical protein